MLQTFADWLKRRRDRDELSLLDSSERHRVASDLGLSVAELDRVVSESHDPVQLPLMLAALGIDEDALRRAEPAMLRDMQRVCSFCESIDACNYALAQGIADLAHRHFCPNAESLRMIPRRNPRTKAGSVE